MTDTVEREPPREVVILDPHEVRSSGAVSALEGRTGATVRLETSIDDANDRLSSPIIDCLIVVHDPETFDGIEAAAKVSEKHPVLPIVLFSTTESAAADAVGTTVDEFVSANEDDAYDELDAAVRRVSPVRADPNEYVTDPPERPGTTNVDTETVDEMLESGIERERLIQLLHEATLFSTIFETLPAHLFVKDAKRRHLYVCTGHIEEPTWDYIGNTDPELRDEYDSHSERAYLEDMYVLEEGKEIRNKEEYVPASGEWHLTSKVPWYGPNGDIVGLLGVTRNITERKERERALKQRERQFALLHEASHELMHASSPTEAAEIAASASKNILGYDFTTVRLVDDEEVLRTAASAGTSLISPSERPDYRTDGQTPVAEVFRSGELRHFDDIDSVREQHNYAALQSRMYMPIGGHGVMSVGATERCAFDETNLTIAHVLAKLTAGALTRIESETELQRRNERLEEFAHIVSHDLRNPLNLATAYVDSIRENPKDEYIGPIDDALDRMQRLADELLQLARKGEVVGETHRVIHRIFAAIC